MLSRYLKTTLWIWRINMSQELLVVLFVQKTTLQFQLISNGSYL
jgi:hypothetical protein